MIPEVALQAGLAVLVFGMLALHERIVSRLASLNRGFEPVEPDELE